MKICVFLLTLMTFSKSWSLRCCDSSKDYREKLSGDKAESRSIAKECYATTTKTHAREAKERNKGFEGKDCDYCTVELFVKPAQDAGDDGQGNPTPAVEPKHFYVQSCGSYKTANFEYHLSKPGIDLDQLKKGIKAEEEKAKVVDDIKWSKDVLNFGADLEKVDKESVKRVCKTHGPRTGFELELKTTDVGIKDPSTPAKPLQLDDVTSVICACFKDDCNKADDIVPTVEEAENVLKPWFYG